ncbi:ferritin-like fold-containing protein [Nocardia thailandica]|uniref:Ferritin-like fold-containing protein n=1 Tax=Nocardia thailandica TaxID=257275 RepID=A0ABW6PL99_9NOCA|nr:ferritin-like fold-containing protein [Nocardia thailandica]
MGAQTSAAPDATEPTTTTLPVDHPGVTELFAVLAYGEISAFYRLAEEAALAPDLRGRVAVARMAAAELGHYEVLDAALTARGVETESVMEHYRSALDAYHASTDPSTWLESMVKFYVADGLAADFYTEIAGALPAEVADVVREVLGETSHSQFVVEEVRNAVAASRSARDRLTLWGRRLLGEAITQAQHVMAQRDELAELVLAVTGDLNGIAALFDRMQTSHAARMAELGL